MGVEVFFHEDDYKQIDIIPEENYFEAKASSNEIQPNKGQSSEYGFEKCFERKPETIKLIDKKIPFSEIQEILDRYSIDFVERVNTGSGSKSELAKNIVAWGFAEHDILLENSEEGLVKTIFIGNPHLINSQESVGNFLEALYKIGNTYNLILVDWNLQLIFRIKLFENVNKFLNRYDVYEQ